MIQISMEILEFNFAALNFSSSSSSSSSGIPGMENTLNIERHHKRWCDNHGPVSPLSKWN